MIFLIKSYQPARLELQRPDKNFKHLKLYFGISFPLITMFKINQNYTHIIVIGNGFDLNLGLKTSYNDFLASKYFDKLCLNGNQLCTYLKGQHQFKNWIDIENELKEYSSKIKKAFFEKEFEELCSSLISFLKELDYSQINIHSKAYQLIKNNLGKQFLILDFNYSNSVNEILINCGMYDNERSYRMAKVHGSVESEKIIFGIEDDVTIDRAHIFLKKTCNIHYYPIPFNSLFKTAQHVFFFGHSLGETDHTYFKNFFREICANLIGTKKIDLYYHGKQGYKDLHAQLDILTLRNIGQFKQNSDLTQIDTL